MKMVKKATRKAARPARPARKAKARAAPRRTKARRAPRGPAAPPARSHCTALDPFGGPCQNLPRPGTHRCTIHTPNPAS